MKEYAQRAREILTNWKSDSYLFGIDEKILDRTGKYALKYNKNSNYSHI